MKPQHWLLLSYFVVAILAAGLAASADAISAMAAWYPLQTVLGVLGVILSALALANRCLHRFLRA